MAITVYAVRNQVNGKMYVGKTSQPLIKRWRCHKTNAKKGSSFYFHRSIRKYGVEYFYVHKLGEAYDDASGSDLEKFFISHFDCTNPSKGYNLTFGGDGVSGTEETRRKISQTHKRLGIKPPGNKGRKFSEEWLKNISEGRKGIPAWNKGKKLSPQHISALKAALRPKVNRKDRRSDISSSEIVRLYTEENLNCRSIGSRLCVSRTTVATRLKKAGVVLRPVGFQKGPRIGSAKCGAT